MNPVISLSHIGKTYAHERTAALTDVSLTISQGEFVCLIGASGCGKTSILKLIAGLENPTEGTIVKPDTVAMAFQSGALFPWLTVYENIALGLRQKGATAGHIARVVERELDALHIHELKDKYPSELSGGQRQRVGIARALAVEPTVLLLDEPFSALDPKTTAGLHHDLLVLWREKKLTIVMVSHLIEEAVGLATRIVLMSTGRVVEQFPVGLSHPRHEQGEAFMHEVQKIRTAFFRE